MERAAKTMAQFENQAVYEGLPETQIKGLKESGGDPLALPGTAEKILPQVQEGMDRLYNASVPGPYELVLPQDVYHIMNAYTIGQPLKSRIESILDGPVLSAPGNKEAFLVPYQSEGLRLVLGMDISIGYDIYDDQNIRMYFIESFTFHIQDTDAVIRYQ